MVGFVGTYTEKESGGRAEGIYSFQLDPERGIIHAIRLAAHSVNPSYLAYTPSKKYLYAVNETGGNVEGSVSAFAVDNDSLHFLNQISSRGISPCHVAVDPDGSCAVVSNYSNGIVCVLPLNPDGTLGESVQVIQHSGTGPNADRQECAHTHSFIFDSGASYGFVCDLGSDAVVSYRFNRNGPVFLSESSRYDAVPGSGPRHSVWNKAGTYLYVANELDSTITVLRYDPDHGFLNRLHTVSTTKDPIETGNTVAAIKLSPDESFLYVSNRGADTIAIFAAGKDGTLQHHVTIPSGGKIPRDFSIDPTGQFLCVCHQESNNLVLFRIDPSTAIPQKSAEYEIPSGVCILI
ncbi:6-phosphogluconolactonase [Spirochaetia bacterium]|nr:6-phosphogluconolactonase [Spirochaetia bacterium]GHU29676.1 6-phosphogluconolactonase [Spirochaetia bacterium]